jgi:hypothetical protein
MVKTALLITLSWGLVVSPLCAAPSASFDRITGFPTSYKADAQCIPDDRLSQITTAFFSKSMSPATRQLFVDALAIIPQIQIVDDPTKAGYLIDVNKSLGTNTLFLKEVRRESDTSPNAKLCSTMTHPVGDETRMAHDMVSYLRSYYPAVEPIVAATGVSAPPLANLPKEEGTGFPEHILSNIYKQKIACDGYIPKDQLIAGTRVFIADDAPLATREAVLAVLAQNPRYSLVNDSFKADFLIKFTHKVEARTATVARKDVIYGPGTGDSDAEIDVSRTVVTSTSKIKAGNADVYNMSVRRITHPQKEGETGIVCDMMIEAADKHRQAIVGKNPLKKITERLRLLLADPGADWMPHYMTPEMRAIWHKQGI